MSKLLIFSPETVVKTSNASPTVTFSRKSGLISISPAARGIVGFEHMNFNFQYDENEKTGYLVPESTGFEFRKQKETKGVTFNHSSLLKAFLKANNIDESLPRFQFLVANGIKPSYQCTDGFLVYSLIKLTK